jgi:aspartyl-tRNA(Asn)/glutamyl-tRNA(Gln) amidotransferase subunit C
MSEHRKTEIDKKLMETLAALSAVELTPDESAALRDDLRKILGYVERLGELDPGGTGTHRAAGDVPAAGRDDIAVRGLSRSGAFRNAPDIQGPFFKAPPIIERQDL